MAAARERLHRSHGSQRLTYLEGERLEMLGSGRGLVWDVQGWHGGDLNKLWIKSKGHAEPGATLAEAQALYSRAISPFFDAQVGARQVFGPLGPRTSAVIGFQGLAPYLFELDAAAFIGTNGELATGIEAEYEVLLTQRWIVKPSFEARLALAGTQATPTVTAAEAGVTLRYEVVREFAPYVGFGWARTAGHAPEARTGVWQSVESGFECLAGIRFWR